MKRLWKTNELKLPKTRTNTRNSTSNLPSSTFQQFKSKNPATLHRTNRSISVVQSPFHSQRNYNELLNQSNKIIDDNRLNVNRLNHDSPKLVSALRGQLEHTEQQKTTTDNNNSKQFETINISKSSITTS